MGRLAFLAVAFAAWCLGAAAAPDLYEATRARPLFSPSRRPPPPAATAPLAPVTPSVVQPPAPPPPLALNGVILGPGANVALLSRLGGGEAIRVALGGRVDGWRVSEIRARAVVLTLGDRSVTLLLSEPPAAGALPAPQL